MLSRIEKIRERIFNQHLDALFITNQYNISYLTNFRGLAPQEREGFFFISQNNAYLFTFPTYYGLYEKGGNGFSTLNITQTKKISDHISEILQRENLKTVGFEKENLTVAELETFQNKINLKLIPTSGIVEKSRLIKENSEIDSIKIAAEVTDQAFEFIKTKISAKGRSSSGRRKGVSEKDLALELEFFLKKNADDIAFSPIVAFGKNAAIPHYLPNNNQHITDNSLILLDFGAKKNGYCADMTRVIFYKTPPETLVEIYNTVIKAQELALDKIRVGQTGMDIDKIARDYIISQGYPQYPHGLGHGVGLAIHEAPRLRIGSADKLLDNMVMTVEPGIYIPGECGVRIEDLVVLKSEGIEILSKSPKELTVL